MNEPDDKKAPHLCPLCGSDNLSTNLWNLHDEEVNAVECNNCFAGAPATSWNGFVKRRFGQWIDWRDVRPDDGQQVLCYTVISPDADTLRVGRVTEHRGRQLVGPVVRTVQMAYITDGSHNRIAYWQPIAALPD